MAEVDKGSSPVAQKEKKSLTADDFGKEFLSSWKSMSVTEDDPMDFSFDSVSKGSKKKMNFEKLDMDFNLDDDFGKISSFKVNMPDLDFLSPPKKSLKPKDSSKEENSKGDHQGKADSFSFSFDFNDFNFDTSLVDGGNTSKKSKMVVPERSESQGSKIQLAENIGELDDTVNVKIPISEVVTVPKVETMGGHLGKPNLAEDNCPSISGTVGYHASLHGEENSPDQAFCGSAEKAGLQGQAMSRELHAQDAMHDIPVQSLSMDDNSTKNIVAQLHPLVSFSGAKVNTNSEEEQLVCYDMNSQMESDHNNSQLKESPPLDINRSDSFDNGRSNSSTDNPTENMYDSEQVEGDSHYEGISATNISMKMMHGIKGNSETHQPSPPKHPSTPMGSETITDKQLQTDNKEARGICSRFFKRVENTKCQLHQESFIALKIKSLGGNTTGSKHTSPADGKMEDFSVSSAQTESKLVSKSNSPATELTNSEIVLQATEQNVRNISGLRESFHNKGAENGSKLVGQSSLPDRRLTKGEPAVKLVGLLNSPASKLTNTEMVLQSTEQNVRNLSGIRENFNSKGAQNVSKLVGQSRPPDRRLTKEEAVLGSSVTSSLKVNSSSSSEEMNYNGQTCVNPKLLVSSIDSVQIVSGERNDLRAPTTGKRLTGLSSLKKITGANSVMPTPTVQREIRSLKNSELSIKLQGKSLSKIEHSIDSIEKQVRLSPFLKRKSFEASNADLDSTNPLKRLSPSPSRNLKRALGTNPDEQVCNHENWREKETKEYLYDHPSSEFGSPPELNLTEPETGLVMENDGNVKKAEAYSKELEDICNMLRKKQDEAKEILVRAIVNNNNLLMLNHPIHDEKISFLPSFHPHPIYLFACFFRLFSFQVVQVEIIFLTSENIGRIQKFAVRLMSKELPT